MKNRSKLFAVIWLSSLLAGTTPIAHAQSSDKIPPRPATLASLSRQVHMLADQLKQVSDNSARQQQTISDLKASNDILVSKLTCVANTSGSHDFIFTGCNVHVRNGMGSTKTTNQYGNLIIGYNKNEVALRTGSHNVILGDLHEYKSYGGLVSGELNTLAAPSTTILSSVESGTNFIGGAIIGANKGITDGNGVVIGGTRGYTAAGAHFAVVVGGNENHSSGSNAVAVGGTMNNASGGNALACGGSENNASGSSSTACGGSQNVSQALDSAVSGGSKNTAAGRASAVSGGLNCSTGAVDNKWVVGVVASPGGCGANSN